jgi:DNA-binding MarR family transcriptional regulator
MLNRAITNIYDKALRPLGLTVSQLNILVITAKVGTARPADVCELLTLDPSTLSRNLGRMHSHGWLENVEAEDARTAPFQLTTRGKRLLEKAIPAWKKAQHEAEKILGADGIAVLEQIAAQMWWSDDAE